MKASNSFFPSLTRSMLCTLFFVCAAITFLNAQRQAGDVGIGAQVGQPTGLSLKIYNPGTSLDFLAAWDWDDFFFLNVHFVSDAHLNSQQTAHFFYGPGGFIGLRERREIDDEVELGISGTFGIDFIIDQVEIFFQATPRLALSEETDFDMGGGAGFRVYFR